MRWLDDYPASSNAIGEYSGSASLDFKVLEACIETGARLIARQQETIRHLRSRNCPTVTAEAFLHALEEHQAARFEKWRVMALANPHLARSVSEQKTA
jgi:hypothetical protein